MDDKVTTPPTTGRPVGQPLPHDSAELHVTGRAAFTDDIPEPRGLLHLAISGSKVAHGQIARLSVDPIRGREDVIDVLTATDIPGENNYGSIVHDDPILAESLVEHVGQPICLVIAESHELARSAAAKIETEYEEFVAILDTDTAIREQSFVVPTETLVRGTPDDALREAHNRIKKRVHLGGQDQFYLESHVAMAVPQDDGALLVYSSTQHPDEVQKVVAEATQRSCKDVTVTCRRMGGGFGGKETQPALIASLAAVASDRTGRPCKLRLDRDDDMVMTGKRHDFVIDFDVGFDDAGRIVGIDFTVASRCGRSADLSGPVNDRTMFHCDNAYFLENVRITSHRCKTNTVSNTAFRGFGGPQGMFAIEYVIDEIARYLSIDPLQVRHRNFYGKVTRNTTPYGQVIEDNIIEEVVNQLLDSSHYHDRREEIAEFNREARTVRRGIALTPVKFGISFTNTMLNQAGALVNVYRDGTVILNHGGTEMGQGLFTKVAQVVAAEFGIDVSDIRITASDTSKVPNASATAASSGSDLNGMAAQKAARKIRQRLTEVACRHFRVGESAVSFADGDIKVGAKTMSFASLVEKAWADRVSLSATGFYKTPKIHYDRNTFTGRPFFYFAYGAAVSEVIVDVLTGEYRITRVDILHDVGESLNPAIDRGQIEGGFIQGVGWLTSEELWWNDAGELKTHAPSTYKIPTCSDVPNDFRVSLLDNSPNTEKTIYRSKAVGEPPLMLGLSVFHALRDALATQKNPRPALRAPATPEAVLNAWLETA